MVSSISLIVDRLRRDGYDTRTINGALIGLEEDLGYSYEEAISLAPFVVKESNRR